MSRKPSKMKPVRRRCCLRSRIRIIFRFAEEDVTDNHGSTMTSMDSMMTCCEAGKSKARSMDKGSRPT